MDEEDVRQETGATATDAAVEQIVDESRRDTEESVRDEGRDDAEAIVSRVVSALDERLAPISERLSAIESAQRDTFANVVRSGAIVSRGATEVEGPGTDAPFGARASVDEYDLTV